MAAFDTPLSIFSEPMANPGGIADVGSPRGTGNDTAPATIAPFSPVQTSSYASPRNTVIIHQKSPLLVATPPQVTRALAYSHPFLLPLNRLLGLISWSTGDPWESFLFLCSFWAVILYGDVLIVFAGPVVLVAGLMIGMYSRRFSPLSTYTSPAAKDHRRTASAGSAANFSDKSANRHQKSLDDIVETLNMMTLRCNTLLEPFLKLTDFLSTQYSATSASTRPALVKLLMRMLGVLPVWIILSLPPFRLITGRRVVFVIGTLVFTWHSKPARVCRTLFWRSLTVRRICSLLTGLEFPGTAAGAEANGADATAARPGGPNRRKSQHDAANHLAASAVTSLRGQAGVRFSFALFENQRRWLGIGWTTTLLGYERGAWTDEHLNSCPSKDEFVLPKVDGGAGGMWRWVPGSEWHVEDIETEGQQKKKFAPSSVSIRGKGSEDEGWIYYDNNWSGGRSQDGWGRYTRRRKWVREAELVEAGDAGEKAGTTGAATELPADDLGGERPGTSTGRSDEAAGVKKRKGFFGRRASNKSMGKKSGGSGSAASVSDEDLQKMPNRLRDEGDDERALPKENWDVGDDAKMALG